MWSLQVQKFVRVPRREGVGGLSEVARMALWVRIGAKVWRFYDP